MADIYFIHIFIEGCILVMQTTCEIIFQCLDIVNIQTYKEFL